MDLPVLRKTLRFHDLQNTIGNAHLYYQPQAEFIRGHAPEQFMEIVNVYEDIVPKLDAAIKLVKKEKLTLDEVMEIFNVYQAGLIALEILCKIVYHPYYLDIRARDITESSRNEMDMRKSQVNNGRIIIRRYFVKEDPIIFREILDQLDLKNNYRKVLEKLRGYPRPNALTVQILKRIYQELPRFDNITRIELKRMTYAYEDNILDVVKPKPVGNALETIVTMRELFPTDMYRGAGDVLKSAMGYEYVPSEDLTENLRRASSTHPIVAIRRGTGRELDLGILPLIDEAFIQSNSLHTNSIAGLNKKVLARFDTMRDVPVDGVDGIETYGDVDAVDNAVILDVASSQAVRTLGTHFSQVIVPSDTIQKVLGGPSGRSTAYHRICQSYILDRCEIPRRDTVDAFDRHRSIVPGTSGMTRTLLESFDQSFTLPKHPTLETFTASIKSSYSQIMAASAAKFMGPIRKSIEDRTSLLLKLDMLDKEFRRLLEIVIREMITPEMFKPRLNMAEHLRSVYHDVMEKTIALMESPPNKWQVLDESLKEFFNWLRGGA